MKLRLLSWGSVSACRVHTDDDREPTPPSFWLLDRSKVTGTLRQMVFISLSVAPPSSPAAIQSCEVCFCVFGRGRGAARLHVSAFPSKVRGRRVALGPNLLTPKLFPAGEECKVMDSNGRTLDPVSLPDSQTARPPPSLLLDQFGQRMCRLHQFPFHW